MGKRQRLAGAQRIAPLERALRGGDAALSPTEAAQELARYRDGLLVRGLDAPAPEVGFWSIYALAGADDARVLPKLRLIADADTAAVPGWWTLRQEALWAIGWTERGEDADPRTL